MTMHAQRRQKRLDCIEVRVSRVVTRRIPLFLYSIYDNNDVLLCYVC